MAVKVQPESNNLQNDIEYFFVVSYSCLPFVIRRIDELEEENKFVKIFCFSESIYKFLSKYNEISSRINVLRINAEDIINFKFKRFWRIHDARKKVQQLYENVFELIPDRSRINFYNRIYNLIIPLYIWKLGNKCSIHYIECDPVGLYTHRAEGLLVILKWLMLRYIYPIPFQMMSQEGSNLVKAVPYLKEEYFTKLGIDSDNKIQEEIQVNTLTHFHELSYRSGCEVIWIMQPLRELKLVQSGKYEEVLKKCFQIVNETYDKSVQAVKFHPRTVLRENVFDNCVEVIPNHIPVELLTLPRLSVIITISSTSITSRSSNPGIQIISLVEIIPFINEAIRKQHRNTFLHFIGDPNYYLPQSYEDLLEKLIVIAQSESKEYLAY